MLQSVFTKARENFEKNDDPIASEEDNDDDEEVRQYITIELFVSLLF
jgi:hypothetical protein